MFLGQQYDTLGLYMGLLDTQRREPRPPVVTVMGHIDHGKSTLLDCIRKSNIVEGEAGGITQHINAYEVLHTKLDGTIGKITFIDTPGHESFKGIRARGASIADIAILVVSAEDGVKPQTKEAYENIKEASLQFIVAITKIDKPSANIERTKQSLAENDIFVEGYGGNIPVVEISSKSGAGVNDLLEMIFLIAEIEGFSGDKSKWGTGIIIESKLDPKKGISAVGVIKDGTVKKGMVVASAGAVAPLRYILDIHDKQIDEATFSSPINIVGWDNLPTVGAVFELFDDKRAAQLYADSEQLKYLSKKPNKIIPENMNIVPFIIKADTAGSLEAITYEISKITRERIQPQIIMSGIGTVSENDIKSAQATPGTFVFAFNSKIDPQAGPLAERSGIKIESFDIIYKLTERVAEILEEKEPRIEVEEVSGKAKVLRIFSVTKDKQVLGARVMEGIFDLGSQVRIIRRESEIGRGKVKELQQSKIATERINEGI